MGNIPNLEREELIESVEMLLIMGYSRPTEIMRNDLRITVFETAKRYISIAQRRLRNRYKKVEASKIITKELRDLDFMEKQLWQAYQNADNTNEKTGAVNSIIKCKERRAKLLGLDSETLLLGKKEKTLEDLLREDDEKNEQTINRGVILDNRQAKPAGEISAQQNPEAS